jgi:hypothetical protein
MGSSKFHTVSETGTVDVPCEEEMVTLPVYVPAGLFVAPCGIEMSIQ